MKNYCARYKKKYSQGQVSSLHCSGCSIKSCRVNFTNQEKNLTSLEILYKSVVSDTFGMDKFKK